MKKYILVLITMIIAPVLLSCGDYSCGDKIKWRRTYSGPGLTELIKTVEKQERLVKEGRESPHKLALSYQKLGEKHLENREWNLSIDTFNKTLEAGRKNQLVHYSLGVAYANRAKEENRPSDIDKAEYHYRKSLEIAPSYKSAVYGLALLLFYMKDEKPEGITILEAMVKANPKLYRERMALGRLYYDDGQTTKALAHYQALCRDLESARENPEIREYRRNCRDNVSRLLTDSNTR